MEHAKIGTTKYAVHQTYVNNKMKNGKIIVGKVRSYQNIDGEIYPIIKEVGTKVLIDVKMHYIYDDLDIAITAITTKKTKK